MQLFKYLAIVSTAIALPAVSPTKDANLSQFRPGKYFDRIVIAVFENEALSTIQHIPQFKELSKRGKLLTSYQAITHPSQPNYLAMIAGSQCGIYLDTHIELPDRNIVDVFEENGVSWTTYQEGYTGVCNNADIIGRYARKHNPFMSFDSIRNNPTRCAKIKGAEELDRQLSKKETIPQFVFYTPDMDNDGHDTSPEFSGNYLPSLLAKFDKIDDGRTLFVVTYDEARFWQLGPFNKVYTVLWGAGVSQKGVEDATSYNHYSILKTIEVNWDLPTLGRHDLYVNPFSLV